MPFNVMLDLYTVQIGYNTCRQ